jgi:hypothetical protein
MTYILVGESGGQNHLGNQGVNENIILKFILNRVLGCEPYSVGSGYRHRDQWRDLLNTNEPSTSIKIRKLLD